MDYKSVETTADGVLLTQVKRFQPDHIFDNGQCFRWKAVNENHYTGIVKGKYLEVIKTDDNILLKGATLEDFEEIWKDYFDLNRSYDEIIQLFSTDETLAKAVSFAPGLRVLKQEPWEALATFILSQNNNIKRITGLVDRFCEHFGEPIEEGFAFPTPESIAYLTPEDLAPVRAGFRAKYLIDAAQKVTNGEVSLTLPYTLPIDEAGEHLMQIKGVGPKVSDCVLLFGFNRIESMPKDVWIKRALAEFYPEGFPEEFNNWAGLAQQYLFHYTRLSPDALDKEKKS